MNFGSFQSLPLALSLSHEGRGDAAVIDRSNDSDVREFDRITQILVIDVADLLAGSCLPLPHADECRPRPTGRERGGARGEAMIGGHHGR